jgi:hypothetical protein
MMGKDSEAGVVMSTLIQHEELVRRALVYMAECRRDNPNLSVAELLGDAGMRFNLSPLDQESLEHLFREQGAQA